jgi:hypothetical protein
MNFGLLLPQLPHVQESRAHYDTMLSLHTQQQHKFVVFWHAVKTLLS